MDDSSSSDEELYVVEKILARKQKGSKFYYLLKWEGYEETTWEPSENILDKEMLIEFDKAYENDNPTQTSLQKPVIECDICRSRRGKFYKCQKCSIQRHETCIDDHLAEETEDGGWVYTCEACRTSGANCITCLSSTESDQSRLRCKFCHRVYHEQCSPEFDRTNSSCSECTNYTESIEEILTMRSPNSENKLSENEYLVKFDNWSFRKCFWVPESWLVFASKQRLNNFKKAPILLDYDEVILEEWLRIDKIMTESSNGSATEYLVKWKGIPADKATWEDESSAGQFFYGEKLEIPHEEFLKALKRYRKSLKLNRTHRKAAISKSIFETLEKDDVLIECDLMPYQLEGVNWMLYNWHKNRNCLLADEMGLGKTVQTIALIEHLRAHYGSFPVLVVAPSTVCENWINEFNKWNPKLHHVLYGGSQECRKVLAEYELFNEDLELNSTQNKLNLIKNHAVVTSFQTVARDLSLLKKIPWQMIVVDEAHRLKGTGNQLSRQLEGFKHCFRLLLTGTPLQNNLNELFNILSFLDPEVFGNTEELGKRFENISDEKDKIKELHDILRPRILRRTKKDVGLDESIPPKREIVVPVSMSIPQMAIYKSIIEKNYKLLMNIGSKGSKKVSLVNIWMELRKCVNHAYLIIDEPVANDTQKALEQLISMSGKLELLDRMLIKMKEKGHRVLIFSQMTRMLDIIQDYLDLKGYSCGQLDGQTPVSDRQNLVNEFNNPASKTFCFLLSTRAGGLGINLTTADTVIMFDHDYNPHNDLQALCRAHRIGQTKVLHIYRLVTVNSIEESVVAISKKKLLLDHLVVGSMNKVSEDDVSQILKMGVQKLFEGEAQQRVTYDEDALEKLLDRSQTDSPSDSADDNSTAGDNRMKIFNEEVFSHAKMWENDPELSKDGKTNDADFWSKYLGDVKFSTPKKEYGKGHRRHKTINFHEASYWKEATVEATKESDWESESSSSGESSVSGDLHQAFMADVSSSELAKSFPGSNQTMEPISTELRAKAAGSTTGRNENSANLIRIPRYAVPAPSPAVEASVSEGNKSVSKVDVLNIIKQAQPVGTSIGILLKLIKSTPLLQDTQRLHLFRAIAAGCQYDPREIPPISAARMAHGIYGLTPMNVCGKPGVLCVLHAKEIRRIYTFFAPMVAIKSSGITSVDSNVPFGSLSQKRSLDGTPFAEDFKINEASKLNATSNIPMNVSARPPYQLDNANFSETKQLSGKSVPPIPVESLLPKTVEAVTDLIKVESNNEGKTITEVDLTLEDDATPVDLDAICRSSPQKVNLLLKEEPRYSTPVKQPVHSIVKSPVPGVTGLKDQLKSGSPSIKFSIPKKQSSTGVSTWDNRVITLKVNSASQKQMLPLKSEKSPMINSAVNVVPIELKSKQFPENASKTTPKSEFRSDSSVATDPIEVLPVPIQARTNGKQEVSSVDLVAKAMAMAVHLPPKRLKIDSSLMDKPVLKFGESSSAINSSKQISQAEIPQITPKTLGPNFSEHGNESNSQKGYNETLLAIQTAQLKRLASENQMLKRENEILRAMFKNPQVASDTLTRPEPTIPDQVEFEEFYKLPKELQMVCKWNGCFHSTRSRHLLRMHVRDAHLDSMKKN